MYPEPEKQERKKHGVLLVLVAIAIMATGLVVFSRTVQAKEGSITLNPDEWFEAKSLEVEDSALKKKWTDFNGRLQAAHVNQMPVGYTWTLDMTIRPYGAIVRGSPIPVPTTPSVPAKR